MNRIVYLLYITFIETPFVMVFLANISGVTTIWTNYQRAQIYEMVYQRDIAIAKGNLSDQLESERRK
jgi:hypothetical protein